MTGSHPLVAAFPTCLGARDAAVSLREGGLHEIWIGVTVPETSIKPSLTRHGVEEAEAVRVECRLGADDVVLTVASDNYPELAAEIIEAAGGIVLSGGTFYCAAPPAPKATVPTIAREVDLSGVVRLSERRKAPRHLSPYKQVS